MDIDTVIDDIYDGGTSDWLSVGRSLFECLGANGGSMRFRQSGGGSVNVLQTARPGEARYTDYYCGIDPVRSALTRFASNQNQPITALVVDDLVDGDRYRRSEFYQDFARPNGQEHMLLGVVGGDDRMIIGLFREGRAFGDRETSTLSRLLPHVRRVVHLRQRLHKAEHLARLGYAAFEALPTSAVVVDSDCHVVYANSSAERALSQRDLPIYLSPQVNSGKMRLNVDNRGRAVQLNAMISDAAYGGNGGAMRFELEAGKGNQVRQFAVFVLPQPTQFSASTVFAGQGDPVLIMIHELSRPTVISPLLLKDLFGLSAAESAVAMALLGGQTSEAVARNREVSLETVRTQIRMVLRKTNAANLREFERIGAMLDMLAH
jgi:DNA-binding CsgD family transcriptional regulator